MAIEKKGGETGDKVIQGSKKQKNDTAPVRLNPYEKNDRIPKRRATRTQRMFDGTGLVTHPAETRRGTLSDKLNNDADWLLNTAALNSRLPKNSLDRIWFDQQVTDVYSDAGYNAAKGAELDANFKPGLMQDKDKVKVKENIGRLSRRMNYLLLYPRMAEDIDNCLYDIRSNQIYLDSFDDIRDNSVQAKKHYYKANNYCANAFQNAMAHFGGRDKNYAIDKKIDGAITAKLGSKIRKIQDIQKGTYVEECKRLNNEYTKWNQWFLGNHIGSTDLKSEYYQLNLKGQGLITQAQNQLGLPSVNMGFALISLDEAAATQNESEKNCFSLDEAAATQNESKKSSVDLGLVGKNLKDCRIILAEIENEVVDRLPLDQRQAVSRLFDVLPSYATDHGQKWFEYINRSAVISDETRANVLALYIKAHDSIMQALHDKKSFDQTTKQNVLDFRNYLFQAGIDLPNSDAMKQQQQSEPQWASRYDQNLSWLRGQGTSQNISTSPLTDSPKPMHPQLNQGSYTDVGPNQLHSHTDPGRRTYQPSQVGGYHSFTMPFQYPQGNPGQAFAGADNNALQPYQASTSNTFQNRPAYVQLQQSDSFDYGYHPQRYFAGTSYDYQQFNQPRTQYGTDFAPFPDQTQLQLSKKDGKQTASIDNWQRVEIPQESKADVKKQNRGDAKKGSDKWKQRGKKLTHVAAIPFRSLSSGVKKLTKEVWRGAKSLGRTEQVVSDPILLNPEVFSSSKLNQQTGKNTKRQELPRIEPLSIPPNVSRDLLLSPQVLKSTDLLEGTSNPYQNNPYFGNSNGPGRNPL